MPDLKNDWEKYAGKDRVQSFAVIMALFTLLLLTEQIPVELFGEVSKFSIFGLFGADAADNVTNFRK